MGVLSAVWIVTLYCARMGVCLQIGTMCVICKSFLPFRGLPLTPLTLPVLLCEAPLTYNTLFVSGVQHGADKCAQPVPAQDYHSAVRYGPQAMLLIPQTILFYFNLFSGDIHFAAGSLYSSPLPHVARPRPAAAATSRLFPTTHILERASLGPLCVPGRSGRAVCGRGPPSPRAAFRERGRASGRPGSTPPGNQEKP